MKKIMFSDAYCLTEAVLSGRKTKTRRNTSKFIPDAIQMGFNCLVIFNGMELRCYNDAGTFIKYKLPYQVGEIVAVAQSYKDAGVVFLPEEDEEFGCHNFPAEQTAGWTNKMFVRADLMPHQIRMTNVRVERLNDISEVDCIAEGIIKGALGTEYAALAGAYYVPNRPLEPFITPREAYAALIDRISGKGTWENNPLALAYGFELVK